MCMSTPKVKVPDPVPPTPPPPPPPPPTKTAKRVENKTLKSRNTRSKRRGASALTIRRSSTVNTGSSGTGVNMSY